ncbi:MAG: hypothetical protein KFB93_05140 [Simkaniaceae bacterium]|nr:MAG: hypothetical protein KFB93_05140 [Simkaniaceae bacterium]
MSTQREPTPFDDPFPGAGGILRKELSKSLESFIYTFEHEAQDKSCMSRQLNLNEGLMIERSKEIGGKVYLHMQELMQASTDYANGHGKIEMVYECLEFLRDELKS